MKQLIKMILLGASILTFSAINVQAGSNNGFQGKASNAREIGSGQQSYSFTVDTSNDVFTNPQALEKATGGMQFIDDNGDGICDVAQDSPTFEALNAGNFVDNNGDGIHDGFQTREFYQLLKMDNYVDVDGDGICDNYEQTPIAE
jgi:hypothetical protein